MREAVPALHRRAPVPATICVSCWNSRATPAAGSSGSSSPSGTAIRPPAYAASTNAPTDNYTAGSPRRSPPLPVFVLREHWTPSGSECGATAHGSLPRVVLCGTRCPLSRLPRSSCTSTRVWCSPSLTLLRVKAADRADPPANPSSGAFRRLSRQKTPLDRNRRVCAAPSPPDFCFRLRGAASRRPPGECRIHAEQQPAPHHAGFRFRPPAARPLAPTRPGRGD